MKVIDVPVTPKTSTIIADKRQGVALIAPLQSEVTALGIITTPEEYEVADAIFGKIKAVRKTWKLKMYGTKDKPGPIPSIKSGLDQLYELNREVDGPLGKLEDAVERGMKDFKLKELADIRRAENEKARLEEEERRRIYDLEQKAAALKTPAAKARVEQQIEEAAQRLDETQQQAVPEKTMGVNSNVRPKQIPVVIDASGFIRGVAEGTIPEDCISINMVKLRAYYKEDPEAVAMFPGVEIQDDVEIRGRS